MNGVVRKIEHDMQYAGLLATQRQVEEIKKWKEAQRDGHSPLLGCRTLTHPHTLSRHNILSLVTHMTTNDVS